jgi:predicted ArsR family transcriptional regulator
VPPGSHSPDDVLAPAVRSRLLAALAGLMRPATTQELAALVGRHPNAVRVQLHKLADAGVLERRTARQARGRPRHEWTIARGGDRPEAHRQLAGWLARALARPPGLAEIEQLGREIGDELAPRRGERSLESAMQDALNALGFAPALTQPAPGRLRFELRNCPYREAVRENQPALCTLHRGITSGLLARLDPAARVDGFAARDPDTAGCLIDITASTAT